MSVLCHHSQWTEHKQLHCTEVNGEKIVVKIDISPKNTNYRDEKYKVKMRLTLVKCARILFDSDDFIDAIE